MVLYWHGDQVEAAVKAAAARGLNQAAEELLSLSKALVPVDSGDLRSSGSVDQASAGDLESRVTYNTPYAVIQHERLDFHHPTVKNPNAQAKYLEAPARENETELLGIVAQTIKRSMGG